jgi:hypothetical protein
VSSAPHLLHGDDLGALRSDCSSRNLPKGKVAVLFGGAICHREPDLSRRVESGSPESHIPRQRRRFSTEL